MKRRKVLMLIGVLCLMLALVAVLFTACTPTPETPTTPPPSEEPEQGQQTEIIKWKFQSKSPPAVCVADADKHFCEVINKLAGGRLEVKYYTGGELIPGPELFDAVASGALDGGGAWPGWWGGKNTAFSLLGSFPMLLGPGDYYVWLWEGGGLEACQELFGKYGIVAWPEACVGMESGIRSNEPIRTLEDFKNLKIRMSGIPQSAILEKLGASQTKIASNELYQALQRGVVDAGECSTPTIDWTIGLQEITKYWCAPGWHQPNTLMVAMINKDSWDALSDDLKGIIEEAAKVTFCEMWASFEMRNAEYTKKFIDAGVEVTRLSDADLAQIQQYAWEELLKEARDNPDFAKIAYSQVKFLDEYAQWRSVSSPFNFGRNPEGVQEVLEELETLVK